MDVMTPLRAMLDHITAHHTILYHATNSVSLSLRFASYRSIYRSSFFLFAVSYTFSTFVMFSANSPDNFSNKIRERLTSSRVRRHAPAALSKRRCFWKRARSSNVFDGLWEVPWLSGGLWYSLIHLFRLSVLELF